MKDGMKILVVDDNQSIGELLKETLGDEGYQVAVSGRGEDALEELHRQPFQLVLLDLVLPGMHGIQVLRQIKQDFPKTDVGMMTSHASVDTALDALRLGAQDYLIKPFDDLEMVLRVVNRTLAKQRLANENERLVQELKTKNTQLELMVKRLSSLNGTGQALHSILDLNELLEYFVRLMATDLRAERTSIMLLDPTTKELFIKVAEGITDELVRNTRVKLGEGVAGWVAQTGKAVLVEDIEADPRFQKQDRPYQTDSFISAPVVLSVPLKSKKACPPVNDAKGLMRR